MAHKDIKSFIQLKEQLREMFQLDRGDLDFGIYRIMNQKREEITQFLDDQLLPQVRSVLAQYQPDQYSQSKEELEKIIQSLKEAGVDPETSPKVKELQNKVGQSVDIDKVEKEIYSNLYNFFKRYYSDGDFMSMRRYKEGVYALPYEGEEVKLHWANHDQYYIKTSENLKNYSFKTPKGKRVRFEVVSASTETNNNKEQAGKERRFILHEEVPFLINGSELTIRFEYRASNDKNTKQDLINNDSVDKLLSANEVLAFGLDHISPTENNPNRTLLEKHITDFTAKNTFDYFIHKDLGGFLSRELDFFIKNEIMHLDDIENENAPKVESYLGKIKAMRIVAGKIIQFLAQLEDFQKKLWLKKKFVLETHYCVTLDHIIGSELGDELLPIIAKNDEQRQEWIKLFAIDDIEGDLVNQSYSNPLTVDFLKANEKLLVDTKFYDADFKYKLLSIFEDLDRKTNGVLINSENFQALNLLLDRYREKVQCVYIDPPYNAKSSEILYKNTFKSSSFLSFIRNRVALSKYLLNAESLINVAIDDYEHRGVLFIMDDVFDKNNFIANVVVQHNPRGRNDDKFYGTSHEYMVVYAKDKRGASLGNFNLSEEDRAVFNKSDNLSAYHEVSFMRTGNNSDKHTRPNLFYPIYVNVENNSYKLEPHSGYAKILPINSSGEEKTWRWGKETFLKRCATELTSRLFNNEIKIYKKRRLLEGGKKPKTTWIDSKYDASSHGIMKLRSMMGKDNGFSYPKSISAVQDAIFISSGSKGLVLDYFAGSGTTGHAVINLNRIDGGSRKYILVEMGEYFRKITLPRVLKAAYSNNWKDGEPVSRDGISQIVKYMELEQYEDSLDNLSLNKSETQDTLLKNNSSLNEQYMLRYMLDIESRGSQSLLNIDNFEDPFSYKLRITRNDETEIVNVDMVETFNYLLGLTIRTVDRDKSGIVTVTGTNCLGENSLIVWRNTKEVNNETLNDWFNKRYSSKDFEFDAIYVNGDNNIENMKLVDQTWKVRLIEAEFKRLMFETSGV